MNSAQSLMAQVDTAGPCWVWKGCLSVYGYGYVGFRGRYYRAHRLFWELMKGKISLGLCVLHKCDNRSCVNPDHLFLGGRVDNNHDMWAKGRYVGSKGEKNGNAKLTRKDVLKIRQLSFKISSKKISEMFKISPTTVWKIRTSQRWQHI